MKAGIMQKIFSDHYPLIEASHPLSRRGRRAAENILTCRTPAQGIMLTIARDLDATSEEGCRPELGVS